MTLILFGATGDLAQKKIIPALFELFGKRLLPKDFKIVCFVRRSWGKGEMENYITGLLPNDSINVEFVKHFIPCEGDIDNASDFLKLKKSLDAIVGGERIFHLAIPPASYMDAITNIRDVGIFDESSKILIEKPFGLNSIEAKELNEVLYTFAKEEQIFRIDHYLGKDAMSDLQNISRDGIKSVEANIIETDTVRNRGAFYDKTGAFLDVGQNHLLLMLKGVLGSLSDLTLLGNVTKGQYEEYKNEKNVDKDSQTETYFKIALRNRNIECIIEAGKAFDKSISNIEITYEDGHKIAFDFNKSKEGSLTPYAKILNSAIKGDHSLFVSKEDIEEEWRIADEVLPILRSASLWVYPSGTEYK